jgi:hypothetical protein
VIILVLALMKLHFKEHEMSVSKPSSDQKLLLSLYSDDISFINAASKIRLALAIPLGWRVWTLKPRIMRVFLAQRGEINFGFSAF